MLEISRDCFTIELQYGNVQDQEYLYKRCVAAEPKYGEKWQAISKEVENTYQPTKSILGKVVDAIGYE